MRNSLNGLWHLTIFQMTNIQCKFDDLTVTLLVMVRYWAILLIITSRKNHRCWKREEKYIHTLHVNHNTWPIHIFFVVTYGHLNESSLILASRF